MSLGPRGLPCRASRPSRTPSCRPRTPARPRPQPSREADSRHGSTPFAMLLDGAGPTADPPPAPRSDRAERATPATTPRASDDRADAGRVGDARTARTPKTATPQPKAATPTASKPAEGNADSQGRHERRTRPNAKLIKQAEASRRRQAGRDEQQRLGRHADADRQSSTRRWRCRADRSRTDVPTPDAGRRCDTPADSRRHRRRQRHHAGVTPERPTRRIAGRRSAPRRTAPPGRLPQRETQAKAEATGARGQTRADAGTGQPMPREQARRSPQPANAQPSHGERSADDARRRETAQPKSRRRAQTMPPQTQAAAQAGHGERQRGRCPADPRRRASRCHGERSTASPRRRKRPQAKVTASVTAGKPDGRRSASQRRIERRAAAAATAARTRQRRRTHGRSDSVQASASTPPAPAAKANIDAPSQRTATPRAPSKPAPTRCRTSAC